MLKNATIAALLTAGVFAIPSPAHALDKCDLTSIVAMFQYGEMRFEITRVTEPRTTLAPLADSLTIVSQLGCDMERVRAGVDCIEDVLTDTSRDEDLVELALTCADQVGIDTSEDEAG